MHDYNDKIKVLRTKGEEIQDLIERARANGADHDMQGILNKWEEANRKIFEQYPDDRPSDLSVLEQALEEVHRPKAAAGQSPTMMKKAKADETRAKRLKEMNVNDYLAAIK